MSHNKKVYLAIHGHFYQPPRENPWLEEIEVQESAFPFHDWNSRIACECYTPNSVSKIVNCNNEIMDMVNNYSLMSFNFGPTLMSYLEKYVPYTYERIIIADVLSREDNNGHGNAIAQIYNHIIMPLANNRDKITEIKWGIADFKYRFGRLPEGMWLSETACDDETLTALIDCGIKFTILSPHQAKSVRKIGDSSWNDVSWGNIDPARAYRYFSKTDSSKYIDLFFYDGSISKSVAFDELLTDGNRFIARLKDGVSYDRNYNQLVHIATDGESYGHHTKFGDMALSYVLRVKAKDAGFSIINYANYLDTEGVEYEADIKEVSAWSCSHGVGRWKEDCGCSTGAHPGWNQKWRKPLRDALDFLRDKLADIFENEGSKYYNNPWDARNDYINVILDRNNTSIEKFFSKNLKSGLGKDEKVCALKLMEMQRQALLMYTSCGWFFSEISGLETTQILKYAARAIQLASDFTTNDIETDFLNILDKAKSNIPDFGTGKDVYEKFVKPSVITLKQIATLWAVSSLYTDFDTITNLYCYDITKHSYKKVSKGTTTLVMGRIEISSKITLEKTDVVFAALQFSEGDFHCAIKKYSDAADYSKLSKKLADIYLNSSITEIIRALDDTFGNEYYTLKDIIIEDRRKILETLLQDKLKIFSNNYRDMYNEGKSSILHLKHLGLSVPEEFKLAAQYTLSSDFNKLFTGSNVVLDDSIIQQASEINEEAKMLNLTLDKTLTNKYFSTQIGQRVFNFIRTYDVHRLEYALLAFEYADKLDLNVDIAETQNMYFLSVYNYFPEIIKKVIEMEDDIEKARNILQKVLKLGTYLNINTDFYKTEILRTTPIKKYKS